MKKMVMLCLRLNLLVTLCSSQPALLAVHRSQADENQSLSQQVQSCSSLHQSAKIKYYSLQSKQEQAYSPA